MMKAHFSRFAAYNAWANTRLYDAAEALDPAARTRDIGAYFTSLHGTLNHILVADQVWMRRLTGEGPDPRELDEVTLPGFRALRRAREAEDARIKFYVDALDEADFGAMVDHANLAGQPQQLERGAILAHLFNHQTHHRGQAHQSLKQLGLEPPALDLLYFLRPKA